MLSWLEWFMPHVAPRACFSSADKHPEWPDYGRSRCMLVLDSRHSDETTRWASRAPTHRVEKSVVGRFRPAQCWHPDPGARYHQEITYKTLYFAHRSPYSGSRSDLGLEPWTVKIELATQKEDARLPRIMKFRSSLGAKQVRFLIGTIITFSLCSDICLSHLQRVHILSLRQPVSLRPMGLWVYERQIVWMNWYWRYWRKGWYQH